MSSTTHTRHLPLGRRSPKNAPALQLGPLLTKQLPHTPRTDDPGARFTAWQMLGNDRAGDCVAVTWANQRALITTALTGATRYPDQDQVWALYKTQNPRSIRTGVRPSTVRVPRTTTAWTSRRAWSTWSDSGGPDGVKAIAFAKVDHTNEAELKAAHAIFGQVWYGVNVLAANQTEFADHQRWNYVAGSPLDGGHSITGVGYDRADYRFVTWAEETAWTEAFRTHQVEESWVVIWPEHLGSTEFEQGIDRQQLAAAYQQITGQPLSIPAGLE